MSPSRLVLHSIAVGRCLLRSVRPRSGERPWVFLWIYHRNYNLRGVEKIKRALSIKDLRYCIIRSYRLTPFRARLTLSDTISLNTRDYCDSLCRKPRRIMTFSLSIVRYVSYTRRDCWKLNVKRYSDSEKHTFQGTNGARTVLSKAKKPYHTTIMLFLWLYRIRITSRLLSIGRIHASVAYGSLQLSVVETYVPTICPCRFVVAMLQCSAGRAHCDRQ